MNAVIISSASFGQLSQKCQAEIIGVLTSDTSGIVAKSSRNLTPANNSIAYKGTATAFSEREMRKFLDGVSTKTRNFLEGLAEMPAKFNVGALLKKLHMQYGDIRGILAGLTKRTRTISGDTDAEFFASVLQDDDIDKCISEIHPTTHASLKEIFKKS
jgi:hypothetical protein